MISNERFKQWLKICDISPSILKAEGTGTRNIFSYWDVVGIQLFRLLINKYGLNRQRAGKYFQRWQHATKDFDYKKKSNLKYFIVTSHTVDNPEEVDGEMHSNFKEVGEQHLITNDGPEDNTFTVDIMKQITGILNKYDKVDFINLQRLIAEADKMIANKTDYNENLFE